MTKEDIIYAAGLIDGEGCIHIRKAKCTRLKYGYLYDLQIVVTSNTKVLCDFLHSTFGGHIVKRNDTRYEHYSYQWVIQANLALDFLIEILPYLKLKGKEARVAIEFQMNKLRQPHYYAGHTKPLEVSEKEHKLYLLLRELKTMYFTPREVV